MLQEVAPREKLPPAAYKTPEIASLDAYVAELARRQAVVDAASPTPFANFAQQPMDDQDGDSSGPEQHWQPNPNLAAAMGHLVNGPTAWDSPHSTTNGGAGTPTLAALGNLANHLPANGAHDLPVLHRSALRKRLKRRGKELLREAQLVAAQLEALNELEAAEGFSSQIGCQPNHHHPGMPHPSHNSAMHTPVMHPPGQMMLGRGAPGSARRGSQRCIG